MINIIKKINCSGCETCVNVCPQNCIKMKMDLEGFFYPEVDDEKCCKCGKCISKCPCAISHTLVDSQRVGYAAYNNSIEREYSSSGGVFFILAKSIIDRGGIVVGARLSEDCYTVNHAFATNIQELMDLLGSKYVQSLMGDIYLRVKQSLFDEKIILFCGTPCQIAGLKSFLGKEYENLICVDFICHGVPSPGLWEKNVRYYEKVMNSKIKNVNFRSKKYGGHSEFGILYSGRKEIYNTKKVDPYLSLFLSDVILRPSCYDCNFKGLDRDADITLGDFWGIDEYIKSFNDGRGVSIIVIHSDKGKKLFDNIKEDIVYKPVNPMDIFSKHNLSMCESATSPENRSLFWKDYSIYEYKELIKKNCSVTILDRIRQVLIKIGVIRLLRKIRGI